MSRNETRTLRGPVIVVARTPSFVEQYGAAFGLPDQARMKHIMRATAAGCKWDDTADRVAAVEARTEIEPFKIYDLAAYDRINGHRYGAPMPPQIRRHVTHVQARFPQVQVRIHAHPKDDPVVEFSLHGESLFGAAWLRRGSKVMSMYPSPWWQQLRRLRFW